MPKRLTAILIALLMAPFIGGCSEPVADAPAEETSATESTQIESVVPQVDLATQPNTLPPSDATAKEVCQRFLGLLAQNERSLAEQLLTARALKVTVNAGLELESMGGDGSSVKVGDAIYATSRAKVAQVPCTIAERNGESQSLVWMLRRGESGWRIAGLIVDTGKTQELLSFENHSDVAAIMGVKGGGAKVVVADKADPAADASKTSGIRQVSATDDE